MPMSLKTLLACLATLFIGHSQARAQGDSGSLRVTLERAYEKWRAAVLAKDARAWADAVTQYRQVVTRNQIVSQKQPFPETVFSVPLDPPPTAGLRLLEAQAVGSTAHLLYFGKVNLGGDPAEIPDNLLVLKFFLEGAGWKYDSSKIVQLQYAPDLRAQLQRGGSPDFLDYPEFTPPGKPPAPPPLCKVPRHVAAATLQSHGYETRMSINGFEYPVQIDQTEKLLVIGGLDDGPNEVTLSVKPTQVPQGAERLLQVDIFIAPSQPGRPGTRVFHHESREPGLTGVFKLPCVITPEVLKQGR
jgi:hypothetical protein